MRQKIFRRTPQGEEGAVLIIVVLSLIALFGMMVLVVDVGSLLYTRRALVNAADAAALAAAQSCAHKEGTSSANFQAGYYSNANKSGAVVVGGYPRYFPRCDAPAGLVTVRVTIDSPLFFAPVLGADTEAPVTTQATAAWGGAGAGNKVAPLMLSANRLGDCQIPPDDPENLPPDPCAFWWNNSNSGQSNPDLANAEWGSLDLLNWDIMPPVHCGNSTPPQFEEWMLRGFPLPLPIDSDFYGAIPDDTHTYVCRGQGNFGAALDRDIQTAIANGDPLYFPVNQPTTQIDSNGDVCSPELFASTNCAVDKYDIIGFAYLRVEALYRGNTAEALEACRHVPNVSRDANARCMVTRWVAYTHDGLLPREGENFGVVPVALIA
jgi:Putative Flp pilus-assembly TadE/G-like